MNDLIYSHWNWPYIKLCKIQMFFNTGLACEIHISYSRLFHYVRSTGCTLRSVSLSFRRLLYWIKASEVDRWVLLPHAKEPQNTTKIGIGRLEKHCNATRTCAKCCSENYSHVHNFTTIVSLYALILRCLPAMQWLYIIWYLNGTYELPFLHDFCQFRLKFAVVVKKVVEYDHCGKIVSIFYLNQWMLWYPLHMAGWIFTPLLQPILHLMTFVHSLRYVLFFFLFFVCVSWCQPNDSYHPGLLLTLGQSCRPPVIYVKLRVAHAPGMPGTFFPPHRVSDPDMRGTRAVMHAAVAN